MKCPALKNFRRIVVKVGSSLLVDSDAGEVRAKWLSALAADIAKLHGEGRDVLVVSSGSIALGGSRLKLPRGPLALEGRPGWAGRQLYEVAARPAQTRGKPGRGCRQADRAGADLVGGAWGARHRRRADFGDAAGHRGAAALSQRALNHRHTSGIARGTRDQRAR